MTTLSKALMAQAKGFIKSRILPNHVLLWAAERKMGAPASRNIRKVTIKEFFIDFTLEDSPMEKAEKIMIRNVPRIAT